MQWDAFAGTRQVGYASLDSPVRALAVSAAGDWVAAGSESNQINIYATGGSLPVQSLACAGDYLQGLRFSPDDQLLGAGCQELQFWQVSDWREVELNRSGLGLISSAGGNLTGLDYDAGWQTVDILSGQRGIKLALPDVPYIDEVAAWAVSRDGHYVAMGSGSGHVVLWAAASPEPLYVIEAHRMFGFDGGIAGVEAVAFSPVCCLFASAGYDSSVHIWDAQTGKLLASLFDLNGTVTDVAFSPDGRFVAASVYDGTLHVWGLPAP